MYPNYTAGRKLSADRLNFIQLAETAELGQVSRFKLLDLAIKLPLLGTIRAKEATLLAALIQSATHDQFKDGQKPIVFKSNATLAAELGYARPETISRMLSCLYDAGLITMKDSPNYKRHSTRHVGQNIIDGFGIDLRVLVARYFELAQQVKDMQILRSQHQAAVRSYRAALRQWKNALPCSQHLPAAYLLAQEAHCAKVMRIIGKSAYATTDYLERAAAILHRLTERLFSVKHENIYVFQSKKSCTNAQTVTHIDNTNPYNSDCISKDERSSPNGSQQNLNEAGQASLWALDKSQSETLSHDKLKSAQSLAIDLSLVLKATPFVQDMLPENASWRDFVAITGVMAGICGISKFALARSRNLLSAELIATALAITLQKYADQTVKSPGAYFVGMLNKAENDELRLQNSVFALASAKAA
ncbi:plasmid replication protein RepC [Pseudochrobactrum kiredjianiae]|uniref:Plasmid replication protein RepC n=1 Tax=Pseudochrobactrum kiredjianiae TaxID=386305 RepID=A0ABW3V0Y8_9HYPH|nr:plasmid replication protein RepC [Pseudochrobactrum kiredjianiae]MDM7852949.1 plasmid replication protein RepC [Pseudochrobactrum kiredjianiae]